MLTVVGRFSLFFSAFAPLFVIWALRTWLTPLTLLFIGLAVVGVGGTVLVFIIAHQDEGLNAQVLSIEERQSDVAAYLVTYLIPFVTAPLVSVADWIAAGLFIVMLLIIYVSSDLIAVNPVLAVVGWRLYRVEFMGIGTAWLLSAFRPAPQTSVNIVPFGHAVYLCIGRP